MCRFLGLALLAGLMLGSMPRESAAQHFSFSVGTYGGCHHHHCYWDDPFWWGPQVDYVYVAPPPPPRVVYVQPPIAQETRVELTPPANQAPARSSASASTRLAADNTLQIWNGADRRTPVAFLVNAQEVELADGQSHSFHGSGKRIVEFDRGGTFGTASYELTSGQYEFVITNRGWDLVRKASATSGISLKPLVKKNVLPEDTVTR